MLLAIADNLVRRSVWIIGGDGWAYDIGYGGLDHVLASGRDVNVLVMDTEVYSNTGGQCSKSTPRGAVAKFAAGGKPLRKKDLGLIAMGYGSVYVASVAMGAKDEHTLKAFIEAESYPGPSLIIAYSHCIAHGIDLDRGAGAKQQRLAVESGQWLLYRYDPRRADKGENPLQLDSAAAKTKVQDYLLSENRFKMLTKSKPEDAKKFFAQAQVDADRRWQPTTSTWPARKPAGNGAGPPPKPRHDRGPAALTPHHAPRARSTSRLTHVTPNKLWKTYGSQNYLPRTETSHPAGSRGLAAVGRDRRHQADGRRRRVAPSCSTRLFEEQLRQDRAELDHHMEHGTESFAEALTYFPEPKEFRLGPEEYLKHIAQAKQAVRIPIIASLNGSSVGGWTEYAKDIQQAGADALELNIYYIPTDMDLTLRPGRADLPRHPQGGEVGGHHPGGGEAQPVLHQLRQHGQAPRPGRREWPGPVQPLLPAGH